jgi:HME family heavy-metal exporter
MIDPASPGKEILHPVAVTIFGGLISATLLDAFVTPLLMLAFGRNAVERLKAAPNTDHPASDAAPSTSSY